MKARLASYNLLVVFALVGAMVACSGCDVPSAMGLQLPAGILAVMADPGQYAESANPLKDVDPNDPAVTTDGLAGIDGCWAGYTVEAQADGDCPSYLFYQFDVAGGLYTQTLYKDCTGLESDEAHGLLLTVTFEYTVVDDRTIALTGGTFDLVLDIPSNPLLAEILNEGIRNGMEDGLGDFGDLAELIDQSDRELTVLVQPLSVWVSGAALTRIDCP